MEDTLPQKHHLKTVHELFEQVVIGNKPWEMRWNDRDFQVGDILILHDMESPTKDTGRTYNCKVVYIIKGPLYGLMDGWVIMTHAGGFLTEPEKRMVK